MMGDPLDDEIEALAMTDGAIDRKTLDRARREGPRDKWITKRQARVARMKSDQAWKEWAERGQE